MSCTAVISQQLRERGFRITPQRLAILQVLHDGGHLSPTQVFERTVGVMPGLTEATVYRTLEFLAENGAVVPAGGENSHLAYELTAGEHHHMVCRACGRTAPLDHALVAQFYAQVEAATGFRLTSGHLTIPGLCTVCKQRAD
ncbi:MAG: Fur family transcriptional regulator [Chloroflexota bacterium]